MLLSRRRAFLPLLALALSAGSLIACQATTEDAPPATVEEAVPTSAPSPQATQEATATSAPTATGVPIPTPTRAIAPTAVPPSPIATVQPTAAATATPGPTGTPRPASTPTPAPVSTRPPTPTQSGDATIAQLRLYMLDLINADRAKFGLSPVRLGTNPAAQQHADDMLAKYYIGHIDSGGMKPYMRYTLAGGLGAVGENAAYAGTDDPNDQRLYAPIVPRERLAQLQFAMMYDDADSNWGHRDQILEPQHQVVNIGIAFTQTRLALIQHFEENYVTFTQPPSLTNGTLTLGGAIDATLGRLQSVDIYYDPTPQAYTHAQLLAQPHSYSIGTSSQPAIQVIPPAPPGSLYPSLPPYVAIAQSWMGTGNSFQITANIADRITRPGVYTLLLWARDTNYPLTTISLFVL